MFRKSLLALTLAACCCGTALAQGGPAKPKQYAILVGVSKYVDLPHLKYCNNDVKLIRETLVLQCNYDKNNIFEMTDGSPPSLQPWKRFLLRNLKQYLDLAQPQDSVLFFFSGHGLLHDSKGYLATIDADEKSPAETAFAIQDLQSLLTNCKAKQKLVILDCCHAGAKRAAPANPADAIDRLFGNAEGIFTLASCKANQVSLEDHENEQGLFTYHLAAGLENVNIGQAPADGNRDGIVTHQELLNYTWLHVSNTSKRLGQQQDPVLVNSGDAVGLFNVAGRLREQPKTPTDPNAPNQLLAPLQRAESAYALLAGNLGTKGPALEVRLGAANTLVEVAEDLRKPILGQAHFSVTDPFDQQLANRVNDWMGAALKVYRDGEKPIPQSLKISAMLAAWYAEDQDLAVAEEFASELPSFDKFPKEDEAVKLQSMLVYAQTRKPDPAGQAAAVLTLGELLEIIDAKKFDKQAPLDIKPEELTEFVLAPALRISGQFQPQHSKYDDKLRSELAKVYYTKGHLLSNRPDLWEKLKGPSDGNDVLAATMGAFRTANEYDSNASLYWLAMAAELLEREDPSLFPEILSYVAQVQVRAGERSFSRIGAARITGGVHLRKSRLQTLRSERVALLGQAIEGYTLAISEYQDTNDDVKARAMKHYASSLAGRGTARVELANLTPADDSQHDVLLRAARQDAEKLVTLNYQNSWLLAGNVYEDLRDYPKACEAFLRSANSSIFDVDLQMMSFVSLGRAQYKAGQYKLAMDSLEQSLQIGDSAEANYFLGKIYQTENDLVKADEHLKQAWDLAKNDPFHTTDYDRQVYCYDWASLALSRSLAARDGTDQGDLGAGNFLNYARSRARELEPFNLWKSKKVVCLAHAQTADIFMDRYRRSEGDAQVAALAKAEEALNLAKSEYDSLLRGEGELIKAGKFDTDSRFNLRCDYCEFLIADRWFPAEFQEDEDVDRAIELADEAVDFAGTDMEKAYAYSCAGKTRLKKRIFAEAESKFRESLKLAPAHPQAWLWNFYVSQLVYNRVVQLFNATRRLPVSAQRTQNIAEGSRLLRECKTYTDTAKQSPHLDDGLKDSLTKAEGTFATLRTLFNR